MDWILDHVFILLAVAGAIANWLNQQRKKSEAGGEDEPPVQQSTTAEQMDEADRARRIQEEIRRKIAERRAEAEGRSVAEPARETARETRQDVPPLPVPVATPARRERPVSAYTQTADEDGASLRRQQKLAEQLAALEAKRAATTREAAAFRSTGAAAGRASDGAAAMMKEKTWLEELRGARSLRKAVVLREVLGTPPGLQ
jgi:hypothetical protein